LDALRAAQTLAVPIAPEDADTADGAPPTRA
jgi:hypothetical protein